MEVHGYASIYRLVLRRPRVPAGTTGFSYHRPVLAILWVFIGVSAVELVAVDLIVSRWPVVRVVLLVLGLWGLSWMFGYLCGMLTRPHVVGPDGIRVRYGTEVDIALGWDVVAAVTRRSHADHDKPPKITVAADGTATLHLRVQNETNLQVRLEQPLEVRLPHGRETVSQVDFWADDSRALMAEVRHHIG